MSSNSIPGPGQSARPLVALAAWLENAHHRDDMVLSFPANTSVAIAQARPPGALYDTQEVQEIVRVLEYRDSMECLAQQRGLCLLANALHPDKLDSAKKAGYKQGKKKAMGQAALTLLIKGFLKTSVSDRVRRWLGILALELLEGCPENTEKLQSDPPGEKHWQYLGEVIKHGSCQVLKLLAGSMIREMLSFGVSPDNFWSIETDSDLYSKFPRSQRHDTQWVTYFEEFVDELVLAKILTQEVSSVMFAHAVYVGDRKWDLGDAPDILVTIFEDLNIIVPANETNLPVYIDVPLNAILQISFDKALVTDSQQPTYGLVIELMEGASINCNLNATGYAEHYVALAFSSEKDANTLRRLLIPTNTRTNGLATYSESGVIDLSQSIISDDELAAPGPILSDNQTLTGAVPLASTTMPYRKPISTINPSRLERVQTSQGAFVEHQEGSSSSEVEHDEYPQVIGHSVDVAAEDIDASENNSIVAKAIRGIDVSQIDDLGYDETQNQDLQARVPNNTSSNGRGCNSQALTNGTQKPMRPFQRTSDVELSSSLRRRKGLNGIQNAQIFSARLPQHANSSIGPINHARSPQGQVEEYDDLYYASPKVKDGQRKSPRILARHSTPKELEQPLEPNVQQASFKKGPVTKLSRQLRNADGVVESLMERAADNDLATSKKHGAGDVKTHVNRKKTKALVPAKARAEESTKTTKKTAQSKEKEIAIEESPNASSDNYDLPSSPTRANSIIKTSGNKKKATTARLKATKAPRKNQKQAKPVLTKADGKILAKGPALTVKKPFENHAKAIHSIQDSMLTKPSGKEVNDDDEAIWDVEKAHSEEEPETRGQPRQSAKAAKKQELRTSKPEKIKVRTKTPKTCPVKAKAAPAALVEPRIRRTAAVKANERIQGLDKSDEIVDEDEFVLLPKARKQQIPSKTPEILEARKTIGSNDNRPTSDELPNKTQRPDSMLSRPGSMLNSKAKGSPRIADSAKDASIETLLHGLHDTENIITAREHSVVLLHSDHDKHCNQPESTSLEEAARLSKAKVDLVTNSGPNLQNNSNDTETARAHSRQDHDTDYPGAVELTGAGEHNHFEDALPYIDDVALDSKTEADRVENELSACQAPTAPMVAEVGQRRNSPRLAKVAHNLLPNSTATRRDPFGAKLKALLSKPKDTEAEYKDSEVSGDASVVSKGPDTPKSAKLIRPSREPKARAVDKPGVTWFEEAKQLKSPTRHLNSAMRSQGQGEESMIQTLKPAGELISVSGVETKRKIEQVGGMSHKRVKITPPEQLEGGSTRGNPAYDAKMTPPPVVSNKPLLISFSRKGPRNQGTISTKKPKPSEDVRTGAPNAVKLRKHDVPSPTIDQVESSFSSVGEALQLPSNDMQHDLGNGSDAQMRTYGPPQQEQFEFVKTLNAVATRETKIQEHRAQKRRLVPFVDDPAPWEDEQLSKRQKRNIEITSTAHDYPLIMVPDPSTAVLHDRSQRLSSQHTRVNENGSPMPFLFTRDSYLAVEEQYLDEEDGKDALAEARLEEQLVLEDDDPILPEPILPRRRLPSAISIPQLKTVSCRNLSNNSKQVPSSPHAPSAFGMMPPYHIYHDGKIVNAETKEPIIPSKPQDPFLGATQNPQNPFMIELRKSTEIAARRPVSGANGKRGSGGVLLRQFRDVAEDPDTTLVEPDMRRKRKEVQISDSSSSSESGSPTQTSHPDESSEPESDEGTEARWREELEPHQENMFECLQSISHRLIRHLIDKETAIQDMVTDFASRGNRLVERYEKGVQEYIDSYRAKKDRRHQKLATIFEKAQADRATTTKAVVKRPMKDMKAQWERRQEALKGSMAAALAACAE